MKYIAAYLLLTLGGNTTPSVSDITTLLEAGGVEVEESRCEKLIAELEGKDINELMAEGASKLASVPSGGAASSGGAAASSGAAAGGAAAEEAPAEEKKEEAKEESDDDMGFGLFD